MDSAPLLTVQEIVTHARGELIARGSRPFASSVAVDSRRCESGSLFVPLAGERTDGHFFIAEAVEKGSSLCLIDRKFARENKERIAQIFERGSAGLVAVDNTLQALQDLSRFQMRRCDRVVRVGVTGSSGKTTTKELIGAILLRGSSGSMNPGNLNSEIGLPLATFAVRPDHRYAIFEMGVSHVGEMDTLADIVHPDIAAITNIGSAHVGLIGSRDAIAAEKKKIFGRFTGTQTGFVFEDEPYLPFLREGVLGAVAPYGRRSTPGFAGSVSLGIDGHLLQIRDRAIRFPLAGSHNLSNALCAVSIADYFRVPLDDVRGGLEAVRPLSGRGEILKGRVTVIQDSYNANPEAFQKAVEFLNDLAWEGRKIVVAGSMKELGRESAASHAALGALLAASTADALFFYGEEASASFAECVGKKAVVRWTTAFGDLVDSVSSFVKEGDIVLVKGSRSMELERLVPHLRGED